MYRLSVIIVFTWRELLDELINITSEFVPLVVVVILLSVIFKLLEFINLNATTSDPLRTILLRVNVKLFEEFITKNPTIFSAFILWDEYIFIFFELINITP